MTGDLGAASWTALSYHDDFLPTRTGTVYAKKFGDQIFLRGSIKSSTSTGDVNALQLPVGYARTSSTFYIDFLRSNANMIRAQIVGDGAGSGVIKLIGYTTSQDIYFDGKSFFVS